MGDEAAPKFEKEFGGSVPNAQLQAYVNGVGQAVAGVSDRAMPYEYKLVRSKVPNAFALPGGKIFITAGLLSLMDNERQLAAVLGHETGHVAAKHNVQGIQRQVGGAMLTEIAGAVAGKDRAEAAKKATQVVSSMVTLKYTRNDEYQADFLGMKYMTKAGYNPYGMVELLNKLKSLSDAEPGRLEEMFQTHPLTSKRIQEAQDTIDGDPAYRRFSPSSADPRQGRFLKMRALLSSN